MNHDEDWSVMGALREWAASKERAMRCIEILASAAGMPVDELMDRIEEDDTLMDRIEEDDT